MTEENSNQTATIDDLAISETVVEMQAPHPGETVLPDKEGTQVVWQDIKTAKDMRAYIFAKQDIKEEIVEVPEWDVKILVRGMNGKERGQVMEGALKANGQPDLVKMYPSMVIATCYHPIEKVPIFDSVTDRDKLNEKSGGVLERLAMVAARLSGIDTSSAEAISKN